MNIDAHIINKNFRKIVPAMHKEFLTFVEFLLCTWFGSVQSLSRVRLCNPVDCSTSALPVHHQLPEFTQTHVHWVGDAIQLSHLLSPPSPPAFNLSQHQGLSNESVIRIRWPKYWSFSFSFSPSNAYSGLISFSYLPWSDGTRCHDLSFLNVEF